MTTGAALVELRMLDGPNLYFPRAAVKLTLDVRALLDLDESDARALARQVGVRNARPGAAGSGQRQRFAARVVARLVRRIAAEAGTTRLAVRSRPTADVHQLVVAFPWRHRSKAEAHATAVAGVLDALPGVVAGRSGGEPMADLPSVLAAAAQQVREAPQGTAPTAVRPRVPVVAVTGTNGKTTTSRMIAHMGRRAGLVVGWSSTDGVYVDGELVEAGDFSGPSGARRVLEDPRVRLAVTETARGGILLRGMGITANDVSVVTNVSADHLGLQGIDTLDQLAEVKAVVTKVTKPGGWVVVNGDDPRTFAMRLGSPARPFVFSRDPGSPALRAALDEGGRAATVLDGDLVVLDAGGDPTHLTPVVDIPMTLAGLSGFNVENALAAAAAGLAIGLSRAAVVDGLRDFQPDPTDNPGRMNIYSVRGVTVVIDLAHNEAGLAALLEVMAGLRPPGARTLLALGTAGDRTDEIISTLGEIGARGADRTVIVHKDGYLRGRSTTDMDALYRAGAAAVGVHDVASYGSELEGLQVLLGAAAPRDVVALMCHQDRVEVDRWLRAHGGAVDDAEAVRVKVLTARGGPG